MKEITKIVINGREYTGVAQMPPEVREQYLQATAALRDAEDDSGTDALAKPGPAHVVVKESIVFNGQKYNSLDELPPEVRKLVAQMPPPEPSEPKTVLEIKTTKTFRPRMNLHTRWRDGGDPQPVEKGSNVPWLLVKILVVIILILLFLLYLSGRKPGGL